MLRGSPRPNLGDKGGGISRDIGIGNGPGRGAHAETGVRGGVVARVARGDGVGDVLQAWDVVRTRLDGEKRERGGRRKDGARGEKHVQEAVEGVAQAETDG